MTPTEDELARLAELEDLLTVGLVEQPINGSVLSWGEAALIAHRIGRHLLRAAPVADTARTPYGVVPANCRLILASDNLLDVWGTRTESGERITAEWGEPSPEGWYEPQFTVHSDDVLVADTAGIDADRLREALSMMSSGGEETRLALVFPDGGISLTVDGKPVAEALSEFLAAALRTPKPEGDR